MRKRSKDEINRLLDYELPGVFEMASPTKRMALVQGLQAGMDPDDAEMFAEEMEHKEAVAARDLQVMDEICLRNAPKNPDKMRERP